MRLRVLALPLEGGERGKESTICDAYGRECSLQNARGHNRVTVLVLTLLNVRTRRIRQRLLSCPFDRPARHLHRVYCLTIVRVTLFPPTTSVPSFLCLSLEHATLLTQ